MAPANKDKTKRLTAVKKEATDFEAVFARLKRILEPCKGRLVVKSDTPRYFYLETASACYRGKPLYFAGVRMGKNYVSFYLMSVYAFPELVKNLSPGLKKRMQGKSCFNFTAVDEELFGELEKLAAAGARSFLSGEFLQRLTTASFDRE